MPRTFFANAFSLNMMGPEEAKLLVRQITHQQAAETAARAESIVGHAETAAVLSDSLGVPVACNRASVSLEVGDVVVVAQYVGPRLAEGATSLPAGATVRFVQVEVCAPDEVYVVVRSAPCDDPHGENASVEGVYRQEATAREAAEAISRVAREYDAWSKSFNAASKAWEQDNPCPVHTYSAKIGDADKYRAWSSKKEEALEAWRSTNPNPPYSVSYGRVERAKARS